MRITNCIIMKSRCLYFLLQICMLSSFAQPVFSVKNNKTLMDEEEFQVIGLRCSNSLISDEVVTELINELEDGQISLYESGNFVDLCRGPHIPDTSIIKAIKLLNVAGAY